MSGADDRRRSSRIRLHTPVRGRAGVRAIIVLDLSLRGIRVVHQETLGHTGDSCTVKFEWNGRPVELMCEVRWSAEARQTAVIAASGQKLFHTGLGIRRAVGSSLGTLNEIIAANR